MLRRRIDDGRDMAGGTIGEGTEGVCDGAGRVAGLALNDRLRRRCSGSLQKENQA